MSLNSKYCEDGEIIETKYGDEDFKVELEVELKVKGFTLICFDPLDRDDFSKGMKKKLCFILLSSAAKRAERKKSIKPMEGFQERGWWGSHYEISGELVAIQWTTFLWEGEIRNNSVGVIDCGIYIDGVTLPSDHDFKIGDYVIASGRLDVYDPYRFYK